jgi:hypothetical protein
MNVVIIVQHKEMLPSVAVYVMMHTVPITWTWIELNTLHFLKLHSFSLLPLTTFSWNTKVTVQSDKMFLNDKWYVEDIVM